MIDVSPATGLGIDIDDLRYISTMFYTLSGREDDCGLKFAFLRSAAQCARLRLEKQNLSADKTDADEDQEGLLLTSICAADMHRRTDNLFTFGLTEFQYCHVERIRLAVRHL